jgi:hypothetical protein
VTVPGSIEVGRRAVIHADKVPVADETADSMISPFPSGSPNHIDRPGPAGSSRLRPMRRIGPTKRAAARNTASVDPTSISLGVTRMWQVHGMNLVRMDRGVSGLRASDQSPSDMTRW